MSRKGTRFLISHRDSPRLLASDFPLALTARYIKILSLDYTDRTSKLRERTSTQRKEISTKNHKWKSHHCCHTTVKVSASSISVELI